MIDFDDDLADILPPFAQNSIINWFENFEIGNLEKKSQHVTFETYQGDLMHGILSVFAINRYRRGLETCPQANLVQSVHAIFFVFSDAFEQRV